jgi:hypothetical protein
MSYCVDTIIGISVPEVMLDLDKMREQVKKLAQDDSRIWHLEPEYYMSEELWGNKGSYVVIAGSFNYWTWDDTSEFARRLSKVFKTNTMVMTWEYENFNKIDCAVYDRGKEVTGSE